MHFDKFDSDCASLHEVSVMLQQALGRKRGDVQGQQKHVRKSDEDEEDGEHVRARIRTNAH